MFSRPIFAILMISACGAPAREAERPASHASPARNRPTSGSSQRANTLDKLESKPAAPLLHIDWAHVPASSDADIADLWKQIAPTGANYGDVLDEIPGELMNKLAVGLLREGYFECKAPPATCGPTYDVPEPVSTAQLGDPCLRRLLALWAFSVLDTESVPDLMPALRAIAALPPPESELVARVLDAVPATDQDGQLELRAIAFAAGHRGLVNARLGDLDDAHVLTALTKHHIDGALELMTASTHRAAFLTAIADDKLAPDPRIQAMAELVAENDKLAPDTMRALVAATRATDCTVAARASRILTEHGAKGYAPTRPATTKPADLMRRLCVLASYEQMASDDAASYLLGWVPAKGFEVARVVYDPYSDDDSDGDGDVHTVHSAEVVARDDARLPEGDAMVRAFSHCKKQTCRDEDYEFTFAFKGSQLTRIDVVELPPCKPPAAVAP